MPINPDDNEYLLSLNLEDSDTRASIPCGDFVAAYLLQYTEENGYAFPPTEAEAFRSFCYSAVIDATGEENSKRIDKLTFTLHSHLNPDGEDAHLTVRDAGKLALKLELGDDE